MSEHTPASSAGKTPPADPRPSFGERMSTAFLNVMRFLARLLLILIVLGLIAGAVYWAVPYAYKHYVQPLQDVRAQVDALQQESTARAEQVNQRLATLQDDLAALQSQQAILANQLEDQQSQWEILQNRINALEQQNKALATRLDKLEDQMAASQDDVAAIQDSAEALQQAWAAWTPQLENAQQQMGILRAMNSLLRARLLIGQANYGLAAEELQHTQGILANLQDNGILDTDALTQAAEQVKLASEALPDSSKAALQNVEAAWTLLNDLFPVTDEASSETVPEASPTPTPTPSP